MIIYEGPVKLMLCFVSEVVMFAKSVGQDPNIINGGQSVSSPTWLNFSRIKQLSGWIRDVSIWQQQRWWWWLFVKVRSPSQWSDGQSLWSSEDVTGDTRCFTRLKPSLTDSAMCGRGYSCVKISQPPPIFDLYGQFVAPERRGGYTTIFRGCFVLDMLMVRPDRGSQCRLLTWASLPGRLFPVQDGAGVLLVLL